MIVGSSLSIFVFSLNMEYLLTDDHSCWTEMLQAELLYAEKFPPSEKMTWIQLNISHKQKDTVLCAMHTQYNEQKH